MAVTSRDRQRQRDKEQEKREREARERARRQQQRHPEGSRRPGEREEERGLPADKPTPPRPSPNREGAPRGARPGEREEARQPTETGPTRTGTRPGEREDARLAAEEEQRRSQRDRDIIAARERPGEREDRRTLRPRSVSTSDILRRPSTFAPEQEEDEKPSGWMAPRTFYDVEGPETDLTVDRISTGPTGIDATQYGGDTRTSEYRPMFGPQEQGEESRWGATPGTFGAMNFAPQAGLARQILPGIPDILRQGYGNLKDSFTGSAAWDRALYDIDRRRQEVQEQAPNVGEVAGNLWQHQKDIWGSGAELAGDIGRGEATWGDVGETLQGWVGADIAMLGEPLRMSKPTAHVRAGLGNVGSVAFQAPTDYAATREVAEDVPLGGMVQGTGAALWDALKTTLLSGTGDIAAAGETFTSSLDKTLESYRKNKIQFGPMTQAQARAGVQYPTVAQADKIQEYSWLNWGDPNAVADTADALVNRESRVADLQGKAERLMQEAMSATSEAARTQLLAQSADAWTEAYELEHAHPIEIVNAHTNIPAQLLWELFLPDLTDVAGGVMSLAKMSPAARRLSKVRSQVLDVNPQVVARNLAALTVGPQTKLADATMPGFRKWDNMFGLTGASKAEIDAQAIIKTAAPLIADADTAADARLLTQILARDPAALIKGIPANQFQSPGLLARAGEDGYIRFGSMGMNASGFKRALSSFRHVADEFLVNAKSLQGAEFNPLNFLFELGDAVAEGGFKQYGVADKFGKAQKSFLGSIARAQRQAVTPVYIMLSPGTWATNILGATAMALGDGTLAGGRVSDMKRHYGKFFGGASSTRRSLQGVETAAGFAEQSGLLGPLKKAYSKVEEFFAERVFYKSFMRAMRELSPKVLDTYLDPILAQRLASPKEAARIKAKVNEVWQAGGNVMQAFADIINGQTNTFSLGAVNPQWVEVLGPDGLETFHTWLRKPTGDVTTFVDNLVDNARTHWEDILQEAPTVPQQHAWMKIEATQDLADHAQIGTEAKKYGIPPTEVDEWLKANKATVEELNNNMDTLTRLVMESDNPKNRYLLYNVWGQIYEKTVDVRVRLAESVTAAYETKQWGPYFAQARQLWDERHAMVNKLLEDSAARLATGGDAPVMYDYWSLLERTAAKNTDELWQTMALEPGSGRIDARLGQVIQAGRQIADKAVARVFMAARRFDAPGVFDEIVSAEKSANLAGSQVRSYLGKVVATVGDGKGKISWDDFYAIRNETWRQLRKYEETVWRIAERNIVEAGTKLEGGDAATAASRTVSPTGAERRPRRQDIPLAGDRRLSPEATETLKEIRRQQGYAPEELVAGADVPLSDEAQRTLDEIRQMQGYESVDPVLAKQIERELNLGNGANNPNLEDISRKTTRNTTAAGGAHAPEVGQAAGHALQLLEGLRQYLLQNAEAILAPGTQLGQGQALRILDEFRRTVLPQLDTLKHAASEYGDRMRSFTMVDLTNNYRADEVLGVLMPYSFWFTRTVKNTAERMLFEPHIFRRVMQTEEAIKDMREQRGDPERYEGAIPVQIGDMVYYLRISPSKYWPLLGNMISNNYADPESAKSALGFGIESMQAMGAGAYPWWDMAKKYAEGKLNDIYLPGYLPQGRALAWTAARMGGVEAMQALPGALRPQFYEYNVGRELRLMATEGLITPEQAQMAQDMLRQMKSGEEPLPEQQRYMEELGPILEQANQRAAKNEQLAGATSMGLGMGVRPYDPDEAKGTEAREKYFNRQYDYFTQPYGSREAANYTFEEHPELGPTMSQGAIWDLEKPRPGVSAMTGAAVDTSDAMYAAGDRAVDAFLANNPEATKNDIYETRMASILAQARERAGAKEVDAFIADYMAAHDGEQPAYNDIVRFVTDTVYPSAFEGLPPGDKTRGMNPDEYKQYTIDQAMSAISDAEGRPVWPGDDASKEAKSTYYDAKEGWEASQDAAAVERLIRFGLSEEEARAQWDDYQNRFKTPAEREHVAGIEAESDAIDAHWDAYGALIEAEDWNGVDAYMAANPDFAEHYANSIDPETGEPRGRWWEEEYAGGGGGRGSAEFAAAQSRVYELGDEYSFMWNEYYDLPKGAARKAYAAEHPEMKLLNIIGYNPDEYAHASELFTFDEMLAWSTAPAWDGTPERDEERRAYWEANPRAWLVGQWMNGRSGAQEDERAAQEYYEKNFGVDWEEAQKLFGEDIWDIVYSYRALTDKFEKRDFYDQYPQYGEWNDWWYANFPDNGVSAASVSGRPTPGAYGKHPSNAAYLSEDGLVSYDKYGRRLDYYGNVARGGGGGGGGSEQVRPNLINMPQVYAEEMNPALWGQPQDELRMWRPENIDYSWTQAGRELRPPSRILDTGWTNRGM